RAREWLEAVPGPEVAAVVEDPVRRQVDLPVHVHQPAVGRVALREVERRVRRARHEPGAHVEVPRGLRDGRELRVVGGTGHVGGEVFQVVAGKRELGEHDKLRARLARARDPHAMHVEVPLHRAERRRALRDRDPHAQSPTRSRSRRSAYSCTSVQARSSSGASAYTLNNGRSASGSTRTHSPSFWCFTPSTCRVFSVCGSCASMRMTRPFCSQGQLTCRRATWIGGVASTTSDSFCLVAARSSRSRTVANSPSNDGWNRGKMNPPTPSPTSSGCSRAARLIWASADARTRWTR